MPPINRRIVITSIFAPGEAMRRFAALPDGPLAVVADRKTPPVWQLAGARFRSVEERCDLPFQILPAHVNFRVTDILRRYVAQPIMGAAGDRLGFTGPTVRPERNGHDCMDDFRSELPLLLETENMMAVIGPAVRAGATVGDTLHRVYTQRVGKGFVGAEEMTLVDAWLADVTALS